MWLSYPEVGGSRLPQNVRTYHFSTMNMKAAVTPKRRYVWLIYHEDVDSKLLRNIGTCVYRTTMNEILEDNNIHIRFVVSIICMFWSVVIEKWFPTIFHLKF